MAPEELLARLAGTMRHEIGPAVAEPFAKTQAFMASVVLEKLSAQLRLSAEHAEAEAADMASLASDLEGLLGSGAPAAVVAAAQGLRTAGDGSALAELVASLWANRSGMGEDNFTEVLARVRATMRARVDRQMAYAA